MAQYFKYNNDSRARCLDGFGRHYLPRHGVADPEPLERSVELARRNEENRKELLLDILYDLRSPLTSIRAYVEGLSDGVASTPEMQKRYLDTIKRKTEDIEKMVSALFAYSKLDMEEFEINMDRHYSLVFHGIIGIVIAATAVIIPFGSFAAGIKSCVADIICLAVGIAAALLLTGSTESSTQTKTILSPNIKSAAGSFYTLCG